MGEPVLRADRGASESLSAAVVFVKDRPKPVHHLVFDVHRARGGGVDHAPQTRDVVLLPDRLGQLEHAHKHGRHKLGVGDPVGLDEPQHGFGVELAHDDRRGADPVDRHRVIDPGGVVHRRGGQVHAGSVHLVAAGQRYLQHRLCPRAVAVGRQHPANGFGPARGARRVQHLGSVRHRRRVACRAQGVLIGIPARKASPHHDVHLDGRVHGADVCGQLGHRGSPRRPPSRRNRR